MAPSANLSIFTRLKRNGRTADGSPSFISEWESVRYLGRGNFGVVYEIVKSSGKLGEQRSALKIIELDEKSISKYKDELTALSSIRNHPHGVSIEDFSELLIDEGDFVRRYLVIRMELLDKLPKDGMPEDDVIKMALNVSDVLKDCHSRQPKILHCDIKPENILITDSGDYKLSDFGEAKFLDKSHGSTGMRGTPNYMSPEMWLMKGYDERSDLYSLGVTMYAMLNDGRIPFCDEKTTESEAISRRLNGEPFPKLKGVRGDLMKIIRKLCEFDPNKRYQRASQLNRDLQALVKRKEEEAVRAEQAEIARIQRDRQKAEAARKREEQRAQREKERQMAAAEREKARLAELERRNAGVILGDTVSAEQREQLTAAPTAAPPEAARKKPAVKSPAVKIAAAVLCAVLLIGGTVVIAKTITSVLAKNGQSEDIQDESGQAESEHMDTDRISAEAPEKLIPLTEADRLLAEEFDFGWLGDGYAISKYIGSGTELVLPDSYNGMPIREIGSRAFWQCETLTSIIVPDGITSIGDYAFSGCNHLASITLPDSVISIGNNAFSRCGDLESFSIPNNVTSIGDYTFYHC